MTEDIHAKTIIDDKFWIVEKGGEKFATLRKDEEDRFVMSNETYDESSIPFVELREAIKNKAFEVEDYINGTRVEFETPKGGTYSSERPECCSKLLPKPKFFIQEFLMFIDEVAKKDNYKFTYSLKYRED
jgi:hypothetical protein